MLWQSGASESATVCFVISLSICYWLFKCGVLCVTHCVCERECVCEGNRSRVYSPSEIVLTAACVQIHTSIITVSVTWLSSPLGLELIKLIWNLKLAIMESGLTFPTRAFVVRPITMHWVSWPIRADCACLKEGLCRKRSVWERRGIEDLQ